MYMFQFVHVSEGKRKHQTFLEEDLTNSLCYCMHLICCL